MGKEATNKINYQGKIVISEKKKAKVIKETWDELTIVFQEKGKYQGKVATVKKGEVSLLDKRKHPEKYPLSAEEKNLEEFLAYLQKKPEDNGWFHLFNKYLKEAKDLWIDVSKYERSWEKEPINKVNLWDPYLLDNLNKIRTFGNVTVAWKTRDKKYNWNKNTVEKDLENFVTKLQNNTSERSKFIYNFKDFRACLKFAIKEGLDVQKYIALLPDFTKRYFLARIEDKLKDVYEDMTNYSALDYLNAFIKEADEVWIDVKKYEKLLPELTKKHYLTTLEWKLKRIQENYLDDVSFKWFEKYLNEAKELWFDVTQYQELFPELSKQHYLSSLEDLVNKIKKEPGNARYLSNIENKLESAKKVWIDVSKYEESFPEIKKNYHLSKLKNELNTLIENPKDETSLRLFVSHLESAIRNWSDVTQYIEGFKTCVKEARKAEVNMDFIKDYPKVNEIYRKEIEAK